jgi:hypothetical protein
MTQTLTTEHPPDICLLLRVHGEQRWLVSKVIPALRQLEEPDAIEPEEQGAALAYLEVLWLESGLRAIETDAAAEALRISKTSQATFLGEKATRYHAAVRRLRQAIDRRILVVTSPAVEAAGSHSRLTRPARERRGPFPRSGAERNRTDA